MSAAAPATLLVTGAGSLASATLLALSVRPGPFTAIAIAARDTDRLRWLARAVAARSAATGSPLRVDTYPIDWDEPAALRGALARARPHVVLHTASWQSAWSLAGTDGWSALVRAVGYGVTLPLQAVLAARVGHALTALPDARLVNACYPDAVNPLLAAAGLPVMCGIGNVATLAALIAGELAGADAPLRLVAHHAHVSAAIGGRPPAAPMLAWSGARSLAGEVAAWLAAARLPADDRLNAVTGAAAVPLLHALADPSASYQGHAPGPAGRSGGYPVQIRDRQLALDLPAGVNADVTRVALRGAAVDDGIVVDDDGRVGWAPAAQAWIDRAAAPVRDALSGLFAIDDGEARARTLAALRAQLAAQPG